MSESTRGIFDVSCFGAVADGQTLNTWAIQAAIDTCHNSGGGRVIVRNGAYLTGTIYLKSNVTFVVERGAVLLGSPRIGDYETGGFHVPFADRLFGPGEFDYALIQARDAENISLEGGGTIDGQGKTGEFFPNIDDPLHRRPFLLRFVDCRKLCIKDTTLKRAAFWTTGFFHCRNVCVDGVTVESRDTGNGDGLDFIGCENVRISNCSLNTGDDSICLKMLHPDQPCRNFVITNCVMSSSWAGIRIGPESSADAREVAVSNCVFENCRDGLKIQCAGDATFENMVFCNLIMRDVRRPLFITINHYNLSAHEHTIRPAAGRLRHLLFSNIRAISLYDEEKHWTNPQFVALTGLPGHHIEDISLENIHLTMPGGGAPELATRVDVPEQLDFSELWPEAWHFNGDLPSAAVFLRHVSRVALRNCRLSLASADHRPFIFADDATDLELTGVIGHGTPETPGLIKSVATGKVTHSGCRCETPGGGKPVEVPLTAEELRRHDQSARAAVALQAELEQIGAALDKASQGETLVQLPAEWRFKADPSGDGEAAGWHKAAPGSDWMRTRIAGPWGMGPGGRREGAGQRGTAWYATSVVVPAVAPGRTVFLRLSALPGVYRIWIDGQLAGALNMPPGYRWRPELAFDITGMIRPGAQQRIVVKATGDAEEAGILQPVEIRASAS